LARAIDRPGYFILSPAYQRQGYGTIAHARQALTLAAEDDVIRRTQATSLLGIAEYAGGSLRGRLLLTGTLGFILYTYMSMCFGTAYNRLFLVYVALFGLSLYAFVLSMLSFDLKALPAHFSEKLPCGWIAGLLFVAAAFLLLAWLGRIAAANAPDAIPALENVTSMFIQAMDLALIVPLCILAGVLLLRRSAWGYLLASVGLLKFLTIGLAVSLIGLNMARVGATGSVVEWVVLPAITLAGLVMAGELLRDVVDGVSVYRF
jgi:hypothetical protein